MITEKRKDGQKKGTREAKIMKREGKMKERKNEKEKRRNVLSAKRFKKERRKGPDESREKGVMKA